MIEYIVE